MAVDIIARGLAVRGGGSGGDSYTKDETDALLRGKQNNLISGENIKTVQGQSILGQGDLSEYKHIVHVKLIGEETEPYTNNNLDFTLKNYSDTEITTFSALMANYVLYETIVVYNSDLNTTNMCVTRVSETEASYNGSNGTEPVDIDDDNVEIISDTVVRV
jgi:hypothetical protein